ncbi:unnamed protein product [Cylicocyclus nassatus]|uniref:Uncharacterized protein n=1 Tax=Cylicocyclus nassatus TaxID=53992 RepID=A0AA36DK11_CYLNA|nr:unnamed protein product [Cylicocyclus nassatus]
MITFASNSRSMVVTWVQIFVTCGMLSAQDPPRISVKDWSCGFTETHKQFTYDLLEGSCAKYKAEVNICCAKHKDCLKRIQKKEFEKKMKKCNSDLCLCLELPAERKDGCGYKVYESCHNARMNIKFIEDKMKNIDHDYKKVMPHGLQRKGVHKVYDTCGATQKYTTRACAVSHNDCLLRGGGNECTDEFKHCMACSNVKIISSQQGQRCQLAIDGLQLDHSVPITSPKPVPTLSPTLAPAPIAKNVTLPSMIINVKKNSATVSVLSTAVFVIVAFLSAIDLINNMPNLEQGKQQKMNLEKALPSTELAAHPVDKSYFSSKEAIECF